MSPLSPIGFVDYTLLSSVDGTTIPMGGIKLVLATLGSGLERILQKLKILGSARVGAMAKAKMKYKNNCNAHENILQERSLKLTRQQPISFSTTLDNTNKGFQTTKPL